MSGPNLAHRVNQHADVLRKISGNLRNVEQRLAFIEVKVDHLNDKTKEGNWTRNGIALMIATKILFEGFGSIDWDSVGHLMKVFSGGG